MNQLWRRRTNLSSRLVMVWWIGHYDGVIIDLVTLIWPGSMCCGFLTGRPCFLVSLILEERYLNFFKANNARVDKLKAVVFNKNSEEEVEGVVSSEFRWNKLFWDGKTLKHADRWGGKQVLFIWEFIFLHEPPSSCCLPCQKVTLTILVNSWGLLSRRIQMA